jgi:hypothetical protein
MIKLQTLLPGTLWNVLHAQSEDSSLSIPEQPSALKSYGPTKMHILGTLEIACIKSAQLQQ